MKLIVFSFLALATLLGSVGAQVSFDEPLTIGHQPLGSETAVSFADLDGDGMEDMIITRTACASVQWHRRLGPWQFAKPIDVGIQRALPYVTLPADLNGNGDLDLVVGYNNRLEVFLNEGAGSAFGLEVTLSGQLFDLKDLDEDGDTDIFTGLHWYPNDGTGAFGEAIPAPYFDTTHRDREGLLAD